MTRAALSPTRFCGYGFRRARTTADGLQKTVNTLVVRKEFNAQCTGSKAEQMTETNWTANWLHSTRTTDGAAGEVIADMRRDPNVPPLFHHIGEMRGYLRRKRAPTEALAALPILWRRYADWLARQPVDPRKALAAEGSPEKPLKIAGPSAPTMALGWRASVRYP